MAISSVSYTKTPQAGDDSYWYTEDELLAASNYNSSSNVLTLNVMSNDLGGNAKKLYSIDDGSGALSDLLASNVTTGWETTLGGNQIRINAGKIEFRFATGLDSLAVGDTRHDSFVYAIQLGNGTISYATVTVDVMGSNDGPRVSAALTAGGIEGGADFEVDLLQGASDIDQGETATLQASGLSFSVNGGPSSDALPAGLTLAGNKLLVDADGSAFDHLASGATEVITVSYFVEDVHGASVAQTATITITGTNDAPLAVADTAAGTENQLLNIDVLANDTDVDDGHVLSLVSASAPAGMGSASVVGGQLQFDPGTDFDHLAKDAVVHVTLSYTMTDQFGAESSSTVDVTVTGSNDAPLAVADTADGTENQLLTIDVLGNDTDVDDGHVLSLLSASAPVGMGSASVVDGKVVFNPGTDFDHLAKDAVVQVTLSYTMTDQFGAESSSTVDVTVTGTNDGPLAVADTAAGTENQLLTIDVLGNDTDVDDGHVLSLLSASAPAGMGSASVVGGQLQFDPGTDFDHLAKDAVVHVTLNYTMTDQFGAESSSTVDVTVTGTNDGPLAVADTAAGTENQLLTIDVLANDTDVDDGHVLSLVDASAPAGMGTASVVDGKVVFNPGTDFDHLAKDAVVHVTLSYTMTDQFGAESNSTVDVTVTGSNDGPVAVADTAAGTENQLLSIHVLGNDTDVDDGHVLSLLSASAPVGMGSASVVDGKVVFNPGTDFDHLAKDAVVHVTLDYTMTDQFGAESSSTVDVTVTGTNDGPVAVADTADGTENQLLTIDVLGNDTDVDDGHVLSLLSASAPAGMGSASVVGGQLQFDPGTDFDHLAKDAVVHVTLSYTMTDQFGAESNSTVDVTITGTNDGPLAVADTAAGTENQLLTIDVLGNDTDVDDGHVLSLLSASAPAGMGSVSVVGGQLQFDPGTDFDHLAKDAVVHVTLDYTMTDQFGAESSSTVDVTVTGTNDLASITGTSSGSVQEATASAAGVPTTGGTLLLSDVDDGEAVFQLPASLDGVYGSFTLDTGSGVWSYLLDNNRAATQALNSGTTVYDTLLVKSYDGTAQQTITVSIQGATDNSAPQFLSSGVLFSLFEHLLNSATNPNSFTDPLLGSVLASDADGNALTYSLLSDASGGAFQISASGAVSVKDKSLLDYESAAQIPGGGGARGYALEVAVSDGIAAPVTTTLYIEVKDVLTQSATSGPDYIDGGSGSEGISGGGQADVIFGDGGDDTLRGDSGGGTARADQLFGGTGNDLLFGDAADDQLFGGADSDMLRGGSGNDALTGGAGSDTFVWSLADISGGPYTDTVKDWGAGGTADKLDLRDLLQGEHANALSLDGYLDFSYASGNTTIAVHSAGAGTAVKQSIVLESIQLTGADDQAIISNLLSSNKLVVDV